MVLELIARDIDEAPAIVVWLLTPSVLVGVLWLVRRHRCEGRVPRSLTVATVVALGALTLQLGQWIAYYAAPLPNTGIGGLMPWLALPTLVGLAGAVWAAVSQVRASATASRTLLRSTPTGPAQATATGRARRPRSSRA